MNRSPNLAETTAGYLNDIQSGFNEDHDTENGSLSKRKSQYVDFFSRVYHQFRSKMAEEVLTSQDAGDIVCRHTAWMDAWIEFTWGFVLEEEPLLMRDVERLSARQLSYLKSALPEKKMRKAEIEEFLEVQADETVHMDPAERSYYQNSLRDLQREIAGLQRELDTLEEIVPQIPQMTSDKARMLDSFLIFARGGYGRKELTFSSDVDIGYCLDLSNVSKLDIQTVQESIKRMTDLFLGISLDTATQYFELGEDLSRFEKTSMLHTIPSILEGRAIMGQAHNLKELKEQLLKVCPQEKIIRYLQRQLNELEPQSDENFYIKHGFGGIRHLQYALWMVLIVVHHDNGSSKYLLGYLKDHNWISEQGEINLLQAMELYLDLRNFLGLYDCYSSRLKNIGFDGLIDRRGAEKDFLDDRFCLAYLKLKHRFTTVDFMDRFRLHSIKTVARSAKSIVGDILDRTTTERLPGFVLFKHLGTNQITKFLTIEKKPISVKAKKLASGKEKKQDHFVGKERFSDFFLNLDNLLALFRYIGKTGNQLSPSLQNSFAAIVPRLYEAIYSKNSVKVRNFIFDLFTSENCAVAVEQMLDIAAPLKREGDIQTLLGLFLPEANQMRYLLRNPEIHAYPLCVHSLKALQQVEREIDVIQKNEPELWRFISEQDVFALKWSTFFHDLGKINPHRNHEELGPVLSTDMLLRLGWGEESEILDLIRLLVANHQSVVRFSRLSTYLDLGILKFFELAQRDPGKVVLLYLINLSDFKSINKEMSRTSAHLERFFERTTSILGEFKREQLPGSINEIVTNYLDRKVIETRTSVLLELLLRQCRYKSLEDVIIAPLKKLSLKEALQLEKHSKELENSLVFLKLAELDAASLAKHRRRFTQIIKRIISESNIFSLVAPLSDYWEWFFTSIPNRYLLSSNVEVLTSQLLRFEVYRRRKIGFSYMKGEPGEYDAILFYCIGDMQIQAKIAYALSWRGVNIENGKTNKVVYANGEQGLVGFFKVSQADGKDELSNIELETVISNLIIPPLNPPPAREQKKSHNKLQFFLESEKGYLVKEIDKDQFRRVKTEYFAVKISLYDAPFCYYKLLRSFEAMRIIPQQATITTIGNQIIDYFYVSLEDKERMIRDDFKSVLHKYLNADIYI